MSSSVYSVLSSHLISADMEYWKGKVAVVTGASAGMGTDILVELAKSGMLVCGLARRKEKIAEIADANKDVKGKIFSLECDISQTESIVASFKWIQERFGKIHVLINNAGRLKTGNLLDDTLPHDEIKTTVDVNLTGVAICVKEAFKLMKHNDNCYIININSIGGHLTAQSKFLQTNIYPATKHGITNLTEHIRLEMAHSVDNSKRIRVTSLSPGYVRTDLAAAAGASDDVKKYYETIPGLDGIDIANAVCYLLSTPFHVNISELTIEPTGEAI